MLKRYPACFAKLNKFGLSESFGKACFLICLRQYGFAISDCCPERLKALGGFQSLLSC